MIRPRSTSTREQSSVKRIKASRLLQRGSSRAAASNVFSLVKKNLTQELLDLVAFARMTAPRISWAHPCTPRTVPPPPPAEAQVPPVFRRPAERPSAAKRSAL